MKSFRKCSVVGCENKHYAKGYCSKHRFQIKKHGKILERTRFDPNEVVIYHDYAEIVHYSRDNRESGRSKIDLDKVELIEGIKWALDKDGYSVTSIDGVRTCMHRLIMNAPRHLFVDHINHDTMDNRVSNLRICTHQENSRNKKKVKNESGHTGVILDKRRNKWQARIKVDYKHIFLGYFDDIEDAIKARKEAEIKYFGEFRYKG